MYEKCMCINSDICTNLYVKAYLTPSVHYTLARTVVNGQVILSTFDLIC